MPDERQPVDRDNDGRTNESRVPDSPKQPIGPGGSPSAPAKDTPTKKQ